MTRRRFLIGGSALVGAGVVAGVAGSAAVRHLTETPHRPAPEPGRTAAAAAPSGQSAGPSSAPPAAGSAALPPGQAPTTVPEGAQPSPSGASPEPIESAPPPGPARASRENLRRGSTRWQLPLRGKGDAEVYASDISVAAGDRLEFHVQSGQAKGTLTVYRLGWYGGKGARVVARWRDVPFPAQPGPTLDPTTGLIRAPWTPVVSTTVPDGWVSGLYLVVVSPDGAAAQYGHFVVRETPQQAPILFVSASSTYQAYNNWGGKSLYPDESTGAPTVSGSANAVVVSWDRPFNDYRGAGLVMRWEYPFVRWLESREYDVAYASDLDLERHPEIVSGRRLIVFAGHPEYWSVPMRRTVEGAIAAGTNVALFSANEMYWRVRFEPDHGPFRTVTCYRFATIDPMASVDPALVTVKWRDPPAKDPESTLIGQMYGHVVLTPGAWVCSAPNHWIFDGTGMVLGDSIPALVGQEYDRVWPQAGLTPPGLQILSVSPVSPNLGHEVQIYGGAAPDEPNPEVANSTIYTAPSGATVFSAGTIQWSWGLDSWGNPEWEGVHTPVDPRVARITTNILDRLGG